MMNAMEMFLERRERKILKLSKQLEEAKEKEQDWKVVQIESKLKGLDKKVFWNSAEKGTYRKPKKAKEVNNDK